MNPITRKGLIQSFLQEDIGRGDLTTDAIVPVEATSEGVLQAKEPGVIAGLSFVEAVFRQLDPQITWDTEICEGDPVRNRQVIARVRGQSRALLTGERVALNLLQRLSGIATVTRKVVQATAGTQCLILDTRKTTPGLRLLEKAAVRVGGGHNHRFALDDAVMVKDNHIAFAGGIGPAVQRVREYVGPMVKIEVETETLAQVNEALTAGADVIMLDNMDAATMSQAVERIEQRAFVEASGGVTPDDVAEVAKTGVNAISLGWLTHSARALDISFDLKEELS